ncbi:PrsW family intramembrane metalloprotease [Myxococcota bacterium]|nr:PrsW family intramembrane metalloprotease [Myxococcota bacterium]MBU1381689.1 PrsW family intramembrane metalloprotease [Myxococcota bacterium]MBU1497355.1 PrsW family intramembrane metalloprotease [Myxococcota bacterium]
MIGLTIALTVAPSILLFLFIYTHDEHPEPKSLIGKILLGGVISAIPVLIFGAIVKGILPGPTDPFGKAMYISFVLASIPEEFFKMAVVMMIAWKSLSFDEPYDGIVYGTASTLGFATLENILYVAQGGFYFAVIRAVTAIPLHAFCGVIMGYFIGRAKFSKSTNSISLFLFFGLLIPILLHGFYDFGAFYSEFAKEPIGVVIFLLTLALTITLGVVLLKSLEKNSIRYLASYHNIPLEPLKAALPKGVHTETVLPRIISFFAQTSPAGSWPDPALFQQRIIDNPDIVDNAPIRRTRGFMGFLYVLFSLFIVIAGVIFLFAGFSENFRPSNGKGEFTEVSRILISITGLFIILNGILLFIKGAFRNREINYYRGTGAKIMIVLGFILTVLFGLATSGNLRDKATSDELQTALVTGVLSGVFLFLWLIGFLMVKKVPKKDSIIKKEYI